ncbi:MBOAT family O-acyltransferase [Pajaroellobacter abortibovis]|uniref:Alginate O-acetyltransferase n=1 Tax=Pajaroellobacter abortibovis TaxID=1882918 RepID=A0A1L6MVA0_9BACT|nr:MBOAT family protein [Pajaroellobacter abortibovis]APR99375.1 hypothetical protein BCY86_00780 [Pajaroellobacter abortibovis]
MLFNSPLYFIFLAITLAGFWLLRQRAQARSLFLLLASYGFYFYGTYDAAFSQALLLSELGWSLLCLGLIFGGSTLDYLLGRMLDRTQEPRTRKILLWSSVVCYMGILCIFKYFNFLMDSFSGLAAVLRIPVTPFYVSLALPFGISFFTFETMSYTIDVYRGELKAAKNYLHYLLFVCFFPHLVAGPIVRAKDMLPQFAQVPRYHESLQSRGLWLILGGIVKKVVIGDLLSLNLVNRVFDNPERFSSVETLLAIYGYAIQIYADFSGYTDVALGSSLLFGYELPQNFDAPYLSRSIRDFWRRWHMSLSTWLRDYLYIPLGGSRGREWKTYRNLMITMLLGGLWHGASWNFVLWGMLHGVALSVNRYWGKVQDRLPQISSGFKAFLGILLTFHYVCFCWIFFRAPTLGHAILMLRRLVVWEGGVLNVPLYVFLILIAGMILHAVPGQLKRRLETFFVESSALVQGLVLAGVSYAVFFAMASKPSPFVYGQF